jgi:hypothetical protein
MRARYAREIRAGILRARDVIARRRQAPRFTHMVTDPSQPLFQRAYNHELTAMVHDGRIKPPRNRKDYA